ncbi:MAG: simple sugar transport system substrate-binding protein [Candidatus Atribacteria bacterium]|nr:simple sugar transport system substrate-binding protein [Candidatus Atribacteria bacterium]
MKKAHWLIIFLVISLLVLSSSIAFAQGKRFEGIKIRFFCGGAPGDPFASVVYKGAQFAQEDLGCTVEYVFSGWDPQQMVVQFKEAVASDVNGIAIMGHPGDDALETHIDEAFSKGIIVTSQNTTLPRAEEKYKARGFGYVGQELYESGVTLGKGCVSMFDLKSGDRAMVWGLLSQPTRGLRTKGVIDALEEAGLVVDYIEISPEVNADAPLGVPILTGYVSSHPDVKLVVTDHGSLTATMQTFFQAAGLGPDDVVGAGFDLSSATLEAIRSGYTDLVLDQQQFLQGYLPVLQLCMSIKYKFSGLHIDTGSGLVHAGNVEEIAPLVEEGIR